MFGWCFGRRRSAKSSISDPSKIQTSLDTSLLVPKIEGHQAMSRNTFLIDLVIEVMLEEADVYTLKTLREMNSNWNKLDLKELEVRAVKSQLEKVDLSYGCQKRINEFLKSSSGIPQLFHSFRFNFPETTDLLNSSFFTKYTTIFLHLEFYAETQFPGAVTKNLHNFFSRISPNLQELKVELIGHYSFGQQIILSPSKGAPIVFPKLTKLSWDMGPDVRQWNDHICFQFILDKSGPVDPTPNLTTLEASINEEFLKMMDGPNALRWTQLTILRIQDRSDEYDYFKFPATLLALGQAGMRLKVLALALASPLIGLCPEFWKDWSDFFATQAKNLQILELRWFCAENMYNSKKFVQAKMIFGSGEIHLPIFETLHTLHYYLKCKGSKSGSVEPRIFEMGQFRAHFPKVVHMRVNEQGLLNIFPVEGDPISLQSLIINGVPNNWEAWTSRIRSVKSLTCSSLWGRTPEAPWKESIKEFQSTPEFEQLEFPYYHYAMY